MIKLNLSPRKDIIPSYKIKSFKIQFLYKCYLVEQKNYNWFLVQSLNLLILKKIDFIPRKSKNKNIKIE